MIEAHDKQGAQGSVEPGVKLSAILRAMVDQVFAFDADGRFTYFHSSDVDLLYRNPEDFLGKSCYEIMPPAVNQAFSKAQAENRLGRVAEYEYELPMGESLRWFHARLSPLLDDGVFEGSVAVVRDITSLKMAQQEQLRLEAELARAQKLESLGLLAGGVAHDFNNMLMSIMGYADLALLEPLRSQKARHHLEQIRQASRRAAELTRQMLAFAGRGRQSNEAICLSELVAEAAELIEVRLPPGVELRSHFEADLPAIQADPSQLRQVILNLLSNAAESMSGRQGLIQLTTESFRHDGSEPAGAVLWESRQAGEFVALRVTDTGPGIPAESIQRIFDPFFSTKFTGRGIGLAAVLGIVRAHKGFIQVDSRQDEGLTTFRVAFPAAAKNLSCAVTARHPDESVRTRLRGRVLLVDDEDSVRKIASNMLAWFGLEVELAEDGPGALRLLSTQAEAFDLVVLDRTMPEMGGDEVLRHIRERHPGLKILMSSGFGPDGLHLSEPSGPDGFISKPYELKNLAKALRLLLPDQDCPQS